MKVGIGLTVRREALAELARAAEDLGFESVWLPEHLVLPATLAGSPHPGGDSPRIKPETPTFDVMLLLGHIAEATSTITLGTWVYNLALRHPLVAARAVQTLSVMSGGRVILGVGAGWLRQEYEAAGVDFESRGSRLNESIEVLRRLWRDDTPEFHGQHFDIPPVKFEPKPPNIPIHVGGESQVALRRAAMLGDGWIGMDHSPVSAALSVQRLDELARGLGRDRPEVSVGATPDDKAELRRFEEAGVDRVIAVPFRRTSEARDGMNALAERIL